MRGHRLKNWDPGPSDAQQHRAVGSEGERANKNHGSTTSRLEDTGKHSEPHAIKTLLLPQVATQQQPGQFAVS